MLAIEWRPPSNSRGGTLATTLMVAAVMVTLAFGLMGLCLSHLTITKRWSNAHQARNLAESLLSLAAARVVDEPAFRQTLRLSPATGGEAVLTFEPNIAASEGLPCSTNNLDRESASRGWNGQIVPSSSAHLVARAIYRGVERKMEAIVAVPAYPYVVASAGPFRSEGSLTVGSLIDPDALLRGFDSTCLEKGRLASNSASARAFDLGPGTNIIGDVLAVGSLHLDPRGTIQGEVTCHGPAVAIPRIPLEDYDPARSSKPGVQTIAERSPSSLSVEGYSRCSGSLHVRGPLLLKGGLLYVTGDLTVDGGLQGKGCLVVEGSTNLSGGSHLRCDNVAALLSRGDVTLEGGSFFQGLVYTEGNITARDVTLLGALIANAPGGEVSLSNSTVVSTPRASRVIVPFQDEPPNLFFDSDEGFSDDDSSGGTSGDQSVNLVARANPDGSYFIYDPKFASVAEDLTLAEAVDQIQALLESHYFVQVNAEQRDQIWRKLRALTPAIATVTPPEVLTVDPNRFLGLIDKARIVLWRPL